MNIDYILRSVLIGIIFACVFGVLSYRGKTNDLKKQNIDIAYDVIEGPNTIKFPYDQCEVVTLRHRLSGKIYMVVKGTQSVAITEIK